MLDFRNLSAVYQDSLLGSLVPFWLRHSTDERCGGYFNNLTDNGLPIESDKSVEQQARHVWAYAGLYNALGGSNAWLEHALRGASFLYQFGHDETLRCYATVDRRGRPITPTADVCTDATVVGAYCQMHRATGNDEWAMLAKQTLASLLQRREQRRAALSRTIDGYRQLLHLSEPVAVLQALLEAKPLLNEEDWKDAVKALLDELLDEFLDKRQDILREWIQPEGAFLNTPEGRRLSPGLTFRAAATLHDLASETGNRKVALQVANWTIRLCEWAWDDTVGGLDLWVDIKNQPLPFPDSKQRWAPVHLDCLAALTKAYFYTRHPDAPKWIGRVHNYTIEHFPDPQQGGWHLALNRQGKPLFPVKATLTCGAGDLLKPLLDTWHMTEQCARMQPMGSFGRGLRVGGM